MSDESENPTASQRLDERCDTDESTDRLVLLAFHVDAEHAQRALDRLQQHDFPMDRVSVLGRASASGDDPLGVYYSGVGERMRGWGGLGAFWGGIWGLATGAAGMFLLPGIGPVVAAGPVVEALAGGAAGAGVGGAVMAGAGAAAELTVSLHQLGLPEDCLDAIRERLSRGEHLVMLIVQRAEASTWRPLLEDAGPEAMLELPYTGFREGVREML